MRRWQRIISALLLLVFVPANSAWALPLVYCFGADGHRAIEIAHAVDSRADRDQHSLLTLEPGGVFSLESDGRQCVDSVVVPPGQVVQRIADAKSTASLPSPTGLQFGPALSLQEAARVAPPGSIRLVAAAPSSANAQLAALRTVVLLN